MSSVQELAHLQIPLRDILFATNSFTDENLIGLGGFGKVYKGNSDKYGMIAIKRLDINGGEHSQGEREFRQEIALLSVYKHENIVSLHGFCDEDGEKILVYKLESKGSLDKQLDGIFPTWIQRLQICIDAACGLKYLHDDVGDQHRILHRDVKSANILLDDNWKAKVSDFGLSKVGPANLQSSFVITNPCGTPGYIDPEYLSTGLLTQKADVFSFGVVLFEVLCGRQAYVGTYQDDRRFLYILAQKHYLTKTLDKIVHSQIKSQINPASLLTFSTIAYECLRNGKERPTMKKVVKQLQKALNDQVESSGLASDVYNNLKASPSDTGTGSTTREEPMQIIEIKVVMDCDGCERKVKKAVISLKGVKTVEVHREQSRVRVSGNVDPGIVLKKVKRTGKKAELWPHAPLLYP